MKNAPDVLEPILEARRYSFGVEGKMLLDEVDLAVYPRARCAIIGPNGAGKSTLLKSFCRILEPGQGELRVAGRPVRDYSQRELARWLAYVPQAAGRDSLFTVRDFVLMGRYPFLSPFSSVRQEDRRAVEEALDCTGLRSFADRSLHTLSGGETQKVLIAAALVQGSRILLLDEPTAFLDPYQQDQVHELLERLHQDTGVTWVEVTHDVNRAALGFEQVIGLRAGRVVFSGAPEKLMNRETLLAIYGKTFTLAPHPANGRPMVLPEVTA